VILTGKNKGMRGKVLKISKFCKNNVKVVVEGINLIKKHVKPDPNREVKGGIIHKEAALDMSNVAIYNPSTQKADRIGFKILDGKKFRYFKSNNERIG